MKKKENKATTDSIASSESNQREMEKLGLFARFDHFIEKQEWAFSPAVVA